MSVQLTVEQTAFLQGPLSMNVGAVGRDGWPCVCRAQGVMVARDRRTLTVLLSAGRGRAVIDAGSGITLVVSRPSTHATLQLKASAATRATTGAAQRACSARCVAAFADELKGLGYGAGLEQALAALLPTDDLLALRFAPEIVFDQTPGPDAGRVLARA